MYNKKVVEVLPKLHTADDFKRFMENLLRLTINLFCYRFLFLCRMSLCMQQLSFASVCGQRTDLGIHCNGNAFQAITNVLYNYAVCRSQFLCSF